VLFDPRALVREDSDTKGEQRFVAVGMDALGRLLTSFTPIVRRTPFG
jgi:hypothetical protein